jgi:hypothetical protein
MTEEEFNEQVKRLMATYGEKAFPAERFRMFWKKFKYTHVDHFEMAIDTFIADSHQPPTLTKLQEHINTAKKVIPKPDEWDETRKKLAEMEREGRCRKCFGTGVIMATHREKKYQACFLCLCPAGDIASELPENQNKLSRFTNIVAKEFAHLTESEPEAMAMKNNMSVTQLIRNTTRGMD